jgi:hypothetical protein
MTRGPKRRDPIVRFMEKVSPEPSTGCWLWLGSVQTTGHALFHVGGHQGPKVMAYRFAYEAMVGPIPTGLYACHTCDVPQCVNPNHIFLGTQKDNMADCAKKGRVSRYNADKTHCRNGHAFEGENLITKGRQRICRTCQRKASQTYYRGNRDKECARQRAIYYTKRTAS